MGWAEDAVATMGGLEEIVVAINRVVLFLPE